MADSASTFFDSLFWLIKQLSAGRLPRIVIGIIALTTIAGLAIAVYQVLQQPAAESASDLLIWGFLICIGPLAGFLVGVGLVWIAAWSLTPVWDISDRIECLEVDLQAHIYRVDLPFSNTGYGAAKNLAIRFETRNGYQPVDAVGVGDPATLATIDTSETHQIQLYWQRDQPLDGILTLTTLRKSGFGSEDIYHLRTYLDQANPQRGWCEVKPQH